MRCAQSKPPLRLGVAPFCAKTSPKAASPRIINAATIMTTKRTWCSLSAQAAVRVDHIQKKFRDDDYGVHGRFPPPWSIEETEACLIVRDANRQALAYVYFEGKPTARQPPPSFDHLDLHQQRGR